MSKADCVNLCGEELPRINPKVDGTFADTEQVKKVKEHFKLCKNGKSDDIKCFRCNVNVNWKKKYEELQKQFQDATQRLEELENA